MRTLDDVRDQPVDRIWLYLTEPEARAFLGTLEDRSTTQSQMRSGMLTWTAPKGTEVGVTIAIYNPTDLSSDEKMSAFLRDGTW